MKRETIFSPCRQYRYTLWRQWDENNPTFINWILLNPSTADETKDDPTIRRCIGFSKDWGFGGLCVTNIFSYRATDPKVMKAQVDPVGINNTEWIIDVATKANTVVCGWGEHGKFDSRGDIVRSILKYFLDSDFYCLGLTKSNQPKHPLYLPKVSSVLSYSDIDKTFINKFFLSSNYSIKRMLK